MRERKRNFKSTVLSKERAEQKDKTERRVPGSRPVMKEEKKDLQVE